MGILSRIAPLLPALGLLSGMAQAGPVSTTLTVTGQVATPRSYDAAALGALPQETRTLSYLAGATPVTDSFTGPTLWTLLQDGGGMLVDPATRNGVLRNYVIATGTDGYVAVVSAGEISPSFGNRPDEVAIATASGSLPNPDGFARLTAAGDLRGGRYVSNLQSLQVGTAPLQPGTGGGPSSSLVVQGAVANGLTITAGDLAGMVQQTRTVTYLSGVTPVTNTFTGPLLWDLLLRAGVLTDPGIKNDLLRKMVVATGSDGYQVVFALGELSPLFGNAPVMVAVSDTAGTLAGADGFARLVVPGDARGGRYVSNLVSLTVFDPTQVPEPAALSLMLLGIAGLAVARRRRARHAQLKAMPPDSATVCPVM